MVAYIKTKGHRMKSFLLSMESSIYTGSVSAPINQQRLDLNKGFKGFCFGMRVYSDQCVMTQNWFSIICCLLACVCP